MFATMILDAPNLEAGKAQFEQLTVQTTTPVDWEFLGELDQGMCEFVYVE